MSDTSSITQTIYFRQHEINLRRSKNKKTRPLFPWHTDCNTGRLTDTPHRNITPHNTRDGSNSERYCSRLLLDLSLFTGEVNVFLELSALGWINLLIIPTKKQNHTNIFCLFLLGSSFRWSKYANFGTNVCLSVDFLTNFCLHFQSEKYPFPLTSIVVGAETRSIEGNPTGLLVHSAL